MIQRRAEVSAVLLFDVRGLALNGASESYKVRKTIRKGRNYLELQGGNLPSLV